MSDAPAAGDAPAKKKPPLDLLIALVNTLAVLGVMGLLVYTRLVFKRPPITEEAERARIESIKASPKVPAVPGTVRFENMLVNVAPSENPNNPDRPKIHHMTVEFTLEIRDSAQVDLVEELKPMLLDSILKLAGKKRVEDLNHVQGRYLLRSEIMEVCNHQIARYAPNKESLVSNVFFTQYTVQ